MNRSWGTARTRRMQHQRAEQTWDRSRSCRSRLEIADISGIGTEQCSRLDDGISQGRSDRSCKGRILRLCKPPVVWDIML